MSKENGNALFLILIATVLFASLSFAVVSSSKGKPRDISREKQDLIVNKVENLVVTLRMGVSRLIMRGCDETEISFYSDLWPTPLDYDNVNSPVANGNFSCHMFHKDGAGITWFGETFEDICNQFGVYCNGKVFTVSASLRVEGIGSSKSELLLHANDISNEFCQAVNRRIGINNVPSDTPFGTNFQGTFEDVWPPQQVIGDAATELYGQDVGCYDGGVDDNNFYAVLMER